MHERKHADLWQKLVDESGEDEIAHAATVSVEQAEADLTAAGFDVGAERAKANAFLDSLESAAPKSAPPLARIAPQTRPMASRAPNEARSARSRPAVAWLAAAAMIGAVASGGLIAAFQTLLQSGPTVMAPPPPSTSAPVPLAADLAAAATLRREANAACDAQRWSLCLANLDKARSVDPDGDGSTAVKSLRDKAIARIVEAEAPGP